MSILQKGYEDHREAGAFSDGLLRQIRALPVISNGRTQCAPVFWDGRHALYKQAERENNIYHSLILTCAILANSIKACSYTEVFWRFDGSFIFEQATKTLADCESVLLEHSAEV